jgi:hypothetical protein
LAEQLAVNQWVRGSNPCWGANPINKIPIINFIGIFLFYDIIELKGVEQTCTGYYRIIRIDEKNLDFPYI